MCRMAIVAYRRAFSRGAGVRFNEERAESNATRDSGNLAKFGQEGIRYGAPGCPDVKLCFDGVENHFFISPQGMDCDEFLVYQEVVAEEFDRNGLPFQRLLV